MLATANPSAAAPEAGAAAAGAPGSGEHLEDWLTRITEELAAWNRDNPDRPAAPFAVNQIVHKSNNRWEEDLVTCEKWQVPIIITSLGAREDLNTAVKNWGGITLHDVIDDRFARKAIEKGATGLIPVAAGAGVVILANYGQLHGSGRHDLHQPDAGCR